MKKVIYVAGFMSLSFSILAMEAAMEAAGGASQKTTPPLKFLITSNGDVEDANGNTNLLDYKEAQGAIDAYWGAKQTQALKRLKECEKMLGAAETPTVERDLITIRIAQLNQKIIFYLQERERICDYDQRVQEALRSILAGTSDPNFSHQSTPASQEYLWALNYDYIQDLTLPSLIEEFQEPIQPSNFSTTQNNKLIFFFFPTHYPNIFPELGKYYISAAQLKLESVLDYIQNQAALFRSFLDPNQLNLNQTAAYSLFKKQAQETGKTIADLLKEQIDAAFEKAQNIIIPMLAPNYRLLILLKAFQEEAHLHKKYRETESGG